MEVINVTSNIERHRTKLKQIFAKITETIELNDQFRAEVESFIESGMDEYTDIVPKAFMECKKILNKPLKDTSLMWLRNQGLEGVGNIEDMIRVVGVMAGVSLAEIGLYQGALAQNISMNGLGSKIPELIGECKNIIES